MNEAQEQALRAALDAQEDEAHRHAQALWKELWGPNTAAPDLWWEVRGNHFNTVFTHYEGVYLKALVGDQTHCIKGSRDKDGWYSELSTLVDLARMVNMPNPCPDLAPDVVIEEPRKRFPWSKGRGTQSSGPS